MYAKMKPTMQTQAMGVVPQWLADAAQAAITLDGVNSAQAMKTGGTTHWLALRTTRTCAQSDALWAELKAKTGPPPIGVLPGECWQRIAPPRGRVTGVEHLLTWSYDFLGDLPARPALILAQAARTLADVIDAEVWENSDPNKPDRLAMYRTGECPTSGQDQLIEVVTDAAKAAGLEVALFPNKGYDNLMGPVSVDLPTAGTESYVHMRHVTEGN